MGRHKGRRKQKEMTRHHLKNRSRFPPGTDGEEMNRDNIVIIDDDFHFHFHQCFRNLSPEEAIEFIKLVMVPNTTWSNFDLERARFYVMNKHD